MHNGLSPEERDLLNTPHNDPSGDHAKDDVQSLGETSANDSPSVQLVQLHRDFATVLGRLLADSIGREVTVALRHEGLGTFSQFVFAQPMPCCCAVVTSDPADLEFYLAIKPSILYPIIDSLVGAKESDPTPQRPMTEIERSLVAVVVEQILGGYEDTWRALFSLEPKLDRFEHNLQQNLLLPGGEQTYCVRYDVRFDCFHGTIELCWPWKNSEAIRHRLHG